MKSELKHIIENMVDELRLNENTEQATVHFHKYLRHTIKDVMGLTEKEDMDYDDKDMDHDKDDKDMDYDDKDEECVCDDEDDKDMDYEDEDHKDMDYDDKDMDDK